MCASWYLARSHHDFSWIYLILVEMQLFWGYISHKQKLKPTVYKKIIYFYIISTVHSCAMWQKKTKKSRMVGCFCLFERDTVCFILFYLHLDSTNSCLFWQILHSYSNLSSYWHELTSQRHWHIGTKASPKAAFNHLKLCGTYGFVD